MRIEHNSLDHTRERQNPLSDASFIDLIEAIQKISCVLGCVLIVK